MRPESYRMTLKSIGAGGSVSATGLTWVAADSSLLLDWSESTVSFSLSLSYLSSLSKASDPEAIVELIIPTAQNCYVCRTPVRDE